VLLVKRLLDFLAAHLQWRTAAQNLSMSVATLMYNALTSGSLAKMDSAVYLSRILNSKAIDVSIFNESFPVVVNADADGKDTHNATENGGEGERNGCDWPAVVATSEILLNKS